MAVLYPITRNAPRDCNEAPLRKHRKAKVLSEAELHERLLKIERASAYYGHRDMAELRFDR